MRIWPDHNFGANRVIVQKGRSVQLRRDELYVALIGQLGAWRTHRGDNPVMTRLAKPVAGKLLAQASVVFLGRAMAGGRVRHQIGLAVTGLGVLEARRC